MTGSLYKREWQCESSYVNSQGQLIIFLFDVENNRLIEILLDSRWMPVDHNIYPEVVYFLFLDRDRYRIEIDKEVV